MTIRSSNFPPLFGNHQLTSPPSIPSNHKSLPSSSTDDRTHPTHHTLHSAHRSATHHLGQQAHATRKSKRREISTRRNRCFVKRNGTLFDFAIKKGWRLGVGRVAHSYITLMLLLIFHFPHPRQNAHCFLFLFFFFYLT
jgi:hypothetical protein